MGWYDSSRVKKVKNFQVDFKAKWDYRGTLRSTSMSLILSDKTPEELGGVRYGQRWLQFTSKEGYEGPS